MAPNLQLPAPLREYQWDGVSFLAKAESALLADEMGLGKTVQAAIALRIVLGDDPGARALILAPASLRLNWVIELGRWAPELTVRQVLGSAADRRAVYSLPIQVLVATYEQLRTDVRSIPHFVRFAVVLIDEAQRIKNPNSSSALACKVLQRDRSWALTGTPVENASDDLVSLLGFVRPGLVRTGMPRGVIHQRMQPFFLRRTKQQVLGELPPILIQDIKLELSGKQAEAYESLWSRRADIASVGQRPVSQVHLLSLITKLKLLCNYDPQSGESTKLDALRLVLDGLSAADDKVIVFSQFVRTLRWLQPRISGIPCVILHGALSSEERQRVVVEFEEQQGPRILLISLRAGGVGLNLNSASTVVMFDRWWNPALEDQAIQRAHRFGRDRPLHVIRYLVTNSIEDRIAAILQSKLDLFSEFVQEAPSLTPVRFTRDELRHVLGLRQAETE